MAPTRELAMQIEVESRKFAQICQIKTLAIFGGVSKYEQQRKLREGVEILIATPGRLLDFMNSKDTNLRRTTYLVLDEADRMLDMGFEKDIRKIIGNVTHPDR
jgi:ATP-dependent RNA helicase DDX5/DBP2